MQFLTWPRFSLLESLDLSDSQAGTAAVTNLLRLVHSLAALQHISLSELSLSDVSPALLCCGVAHCVSLSLARSRLTSPQLEAVMLTSQSGLCPCERPPHRPASLNLAHNVLSLVPPDRLAGGLTAILRLNIAHTQLGPGQAQALFSLMASSETELRHLILRDVDISTVNHVVLQQALHRTISLDVQVRSFSLS